MNIIGIQAQGLCIVTNSFFEFSELCVAVCSVVCFLIVLAEEQLLCVALYSFLVIFELSPDQTSNSKQFFKIHLPNIGVYDGVLVI